VASHRLYSAENHQTFLTVDEINLKAYALETDNHLAKPQTLTQVIPGTCSSWVHTLFSHRDELNHNSRQLHRQSSHCTLSYVFDRTRLHIHKGNKHQQYEMLKTTHTASTQQIINHLSLYTLLNKLSLHQGCEDRSSSIIRKLIFLPPL